MKIKVQKSHGVAMSKQEKKAIKEFRKNRQNKGSRWLTKE